MEKVLEFLADMIDGKLIICDDGFVIESYVETPRGTERVDYIFGEDGQLELAEIKDKF